MSQMIVRRYVVAVLVVVHGKQVSVVDVRVVGRMVPQRLAQGRDLRSATMMEFEVARLTAKPGEKQILADVAKGDLKERLPGLAVERGTGGEKDGED